MKKVKHTLLSVVLIVLIVLFSFSSCFLIKRSISPVTDVSSVSAGDEHTMVLKKDGTLWATGFNKEGQLGDGTNHKRSVLIQIMDDVKAVSTGDRFTMILKNDGTLWATGSNDHGQLGDGTTEDKLTPAQVMTDITDVSAISAGGYHTMILRKDGTLWATGDNNYGQLGDGTTINKSKPVQVKEQDQMMTGVAAVSAGYYHTMIIKEDGTLWAAGLNDDGQLGDGTTEDKSTPEQVMTDVTDVSAVSAVSAGGDHTMILEEDGTLWATGDNDDGQLGDGTNDDRSTPEQVMTGVAAVSAGDKFTIILKGDDGTLWATGDNDHGQLGDGTNDDRSTPEQVMTDITDVSAISAGGDHTMILKKDGTLWGTGHNKDGQLGDGTAHTTSTLVQVKQQD